MRDEVICHGLGFPKVQDAEAEMVVAQIHGRRQEYVKCAHVMENIWLCHPGGNSTVADLVEISVPEESPAKQARVCSGPLYRARPFVPGSSNDKLMAVARWRAEILAAEKQKRQPDFSAALDQFNVDPFTWTRRPKTVVVLWSFKGHDGNLHYEESELEYKSLVKAS